MIRYPRIAWKDYVTTISHIGEFCALGLRFYGGWRLGVDYNSRYTLPLRSQTALGKSRRARVRWQPVYERSLSISSDTNTYHFNSPTYPLPRLYDIYISPHEAAPVQTHRVRQTFPQTDEKIIMYIHGTHTSPLPPSPHDNPSPINHPKKT